MTLLMCVCGDSTPHQVVRDAKFDLEAIAVACDNDLGPYENILLQVRPKLARQ